MNTNRHEWIIDENIRVHLCPFAVKTFFIAASLHFKNLVASFLRVNFRKTTLKFTPDDSDPDH